MALTGSSVKRATDTSGDSIATIRDGTTGKHVQAVALVNELLVHAGTSASPLHIQAPELAAIQAAVQALDNFISDSRGLVTEDNSADILSALQAIAAVVSASRMLTTEDNSLAALTALQLIDDMISGNRAMVTEDNSASIKTAVEILDNFISGARGLVTEDNSLAIKTALELLDDAVSGNRLLVTEDNSAGILAALSTHGTNNVAESGAITYVGKEKADGTWLVQKIDESSDVVITYATVVNNPAVASYAEAWGAKDTTLAYGQYGEVS